MTLPLVHTGPSSHSHRTDSALEMKTTDRDMPLPTLPPTTGSQLQFSAPMLECRGPLPKVVAGGIFTSSYNQTCAQNELESPQDGFLPLFCIASPR